MGLNYLTPSPQYENLATPKASEQDMDGMADYDITQKISGI